MYVKNFNPQIKKVVIRKKSKQFKYFCIVVVDVKTLDKPKIYYVFIRIVKINPCNVKIFANAVLFRLAAEDPCPDVSLNESVPLFWYRIRRINLKSSSMQIFQRQNLMK